MKQTTTKRRVLASFLSLALCVSMLVGSTYAWFTDTVTSSGNIIKSGTLDVGMLWADGKEDPDPESNTTTWNDVEDDTNPPKPIFGYELWEPGYVQVRHIQVVNKGSLALKYNLTILANGEVDAVADLAEVIDVYTKTPAVQVTSRESVPTVLNRVGTLREVLNDTTVLAAATQGHLSAGEQSAVITIALKMQELAGNEYQNKQINAGFDVKLFATQWTEEKDTFDEQYDKMATYDSTKVGSDLTLAENGVKVTVPAASANVNDIFELDVTDNGTNTGTDGKTTVSYEVKLKKNGVELDSADADKTEYTVEIDVGKNLEVVGVYHNGVTVLGWSYNPDTGVITFKTKSFSPFTVEYHAPKLITFNSNTGNGTMDSQNVYAGVATPLDNNAFTKTGYSFAGWAFTAGGEKAYNDGEAITIKESTTLYALWNANPYEVSFNANGGTGEMENLSINYDQTKSLTEVGFTKTGYTFEGWTATEGSSTVDYADGASYTMQSTSTVTLYAVWTANNYTVSFHVNGGEGSMSDQTITYDDTAALTANTFTRIGYTFVGWATSSNGNAVYADGANYTMDTEGITLYAVWQEIKPNSVAINKTSATIKDNETLQLTANVAPDTALDTSVAWTSSNTNVAEVDSNGLVTAKTAGTATITATCNGNTSVYAECALTVEVSVISVQYLEYNTSTKQFTTKTANAVPITGDMTTLNNTGISKGWYAVTEDVTISTRITVSGTVNLILCDSATLGATKGINVKSGNTLKIYAQSNGSNQGVLMASGDSPKAGIGGGDGESGGNITIHGGTVMAQGGGWLNEEDEEGEGGAGIGGGHNGAGGTITIHGGTVTANGGPFGSGIGGGRFGIGRDITINGGNITANSGFYASSIGGGAGGYGGAITINGGTVTATSTDGGAGIGGGFDASGGNISINGGTVTAQGGDRASGIGGGCYRDGGTVTIKGGTVTANGGDGAAGIGGGISGNGANVTVYGGTVTATGGVAANGISCGYDIDEAGLSIGKLTIIGFSRVYSDYNCTQQNTNYPTNRTNPMVIK